MIATDTTVKEVILCKTNEYTPYPYIERGVLAGFPSPANDFSECKLDLNQLIVKNPSSTCFVRVSGSSMQKAGIFPDDLLVVDRAKEIKDKSVVIVDIDGEVLVKRIRYIDGKTYLLSGEQGSKRVEIADIHDVMIWGVVTHNIRSI